MAVVVSSIGYYFSTGFYNVWLLTWLAPLPLLVYALEASWKSAILAGLIAYFIGACNQLGYLPIQIFLAISIVNASVFAFLLVAFRYVAIRSNPWVASYVFASGWTAYEFIVSLYSSYGTFHSMAYTQISNLPIIQVTSITGIWGITFLLTLIPASLSLVWYYRSNRSNRFQSALVPFCLLILTLFYGCYRLAMPVESDSVRVGIVAVPTTIQQLLSKDSKQIVELINEYAKNIEFIAHSGAKVVVLPEKIAILNPSNQKLLLERIADVARTNNITLIVGLTNQEENIYNSAYIFSSDGEVLLKYDKQHLLPAFEGIYTPGNTRGIITASNGGQWGIEICKDMDFVQPARDYSRQGINIMFIPALDFHNDGWLHARIAIMRGVEGNYSVARAAQWGLLTLSDSRGRVIAMNATDESPNETLLNGELRGGEGKTIYSELGDWFGWGCIIMFASLAYRFTVGMKK